MAHFVIVYGTDNNSPMLCKDGHFRNFYATGFGNEDTCVWKTFKSAFKRLTTKKPGFRITVPAFIRLTDGNSVKYFDKDKNCSLSYIVNE